MRISRAEVVGTTITLEVDPIDRGEAMRFAIGFSAGDYEIVPQKKKRSLDANALLWKLCSEIALRLGMTKEQIYRYAIKEVGVYTPISIATDAVQDFIWAWEAHGKGWVAEIVDDAAAPNQKLVFAYKGSSQYDTKQMSRLIDYVVQDAKALGIETLSERERSLLTDAWSCGR